VMYGIDSFLQRIAQLPSLLTVQLCIEYDEEGRDDYDDRT